MEGDGDSNGDENTGGGDAPMHLDSPQGPPNNGGDVTGTGDGQGGDQPSNFDRSLKTTDIWIVVFAGITAAAAIASACVAIWTAGQMMASAKQTDAAIRKIAELAMQTKRQADALGGQLHEMQIQTGFIQTQARAAQQSAEVTKKVSAAHVEVERGNLNNVGVSQTPKGGFVFKNTGETPAYNFTVWLAMEYGAFPPTSTITVTHDRLYPSTVAAGGEREANIVLAQPLTDLQFAALKAKSAAIYIFGEIDYIDDFGRHTTTQVVAIYGGSAGMPDGGGVTPYQFKFIGRVKGQ